MGTGMGTHGFTPRRRDLLTAGGVWLGSGALALANTSTAPATSGAPAAALGSPSLPVASPRTELLRARLHIGVSTHFGMRGEPLEPFEALATLGVDGFRDEAYWDHVEDDTGHMALPPQVQAWRSRATRSALSPLLLLSYGHPRVHGGHPPSDPASRAAFARYARFLARALPEIRQFQIWNEWELGTAITPAGHWRDYLALAREVASVLRAARAGAHILPAGVHRAACFNGYLEALVRGGLLTYVDGLALHTYRFDQPDPSPEAWFAELVDLGQRIERWDPRLGPRTPLYVTEMGYPAHWGRFGVTRERQADYLERCLLLAFLVPRLRGLWWYGLRGKGRLPWNSEHQYGLLDADGRPYPAWFRLRDLLARLSDVVGIEALSRGPQDWVLRLDRAGGGAWRVEWTTAAAHAPASDPEASGRPRWTRQR
jgi:hypothetical protein